MDAAYLDQQLEAFADAVQNLVTWHQQCDDALSRVQVARYQELSVAVRNTLRGLAKYDDATEIFPILSDMTRPFIPNHNGMIGLLNHDVPSQMYVLELFGRRVLSAAETQLKRIHDKPSFQLECGIESLRHLKPGTHATTNNISQEKLELQNALAYIAARVGEMSVQTAPGEKAIITINTLKNTTLKLVERLSHYHDMEYATIAALPIMREEATRLQIALSTEHQLSPETSEKLVRLLALVGCELPQSQHANRALQDNLEALLHAQYSPNR